MKSNHFLQVWEAWQRLLISKKDIISRIISGGSDSRLSAIFWLTEQWQVTSEYFKLRSPLNLMKPDRFSKWRWNQDQVFTNKYIKSVQNKSFSLSRCFLCLHAYFPADHGIKSDSCHSNSCALGLVMRSIAKEQPFEKALGTRERSYRISSAVILENDTNILNIVT